VTPGVTLDRVSRSGAQSRHATRHQPQFLDRSRPGRRIARLYEQAVFAVDDHFSDLAEPLATIPFSIAKYSNSFVGEPKNSLQSVERTCGEASMYKRPDMRDLLVRDAPR